MINILRNFKSNKKELSNLSFFSLGKLISVFGSSIYTFAVGLYVLKITGSGLSFAATLVFGLIPLIIFSPIAGAMADKFDNKKIVVISDFLNGMLFIGLYFYSLNFELNLVIIYISAFLTTTFTTFFVSGMETAKPYIVSSKRLMSINSISKIIDSVSTILGPVVGGLVFALIDLKIFILINGLSFIFSAFLEALIDFKFNFKEKVKEKLNNGFIGDIKDGLKYISDRKDIKTIIVTILALNFFLSFAVNVPLPYVINTILKLSSTEFGIIESSFPIGLIAGSLFVKKVMNKILYKKLVILMGILLSVSIILMGLPLLAAPEFNNSFYLLFYIALTFLGGIFISMIDIPLIYHLQTTVANEFRGRVLSIIITLAKIASPIAFILSGLLLKTVAPSVIIIVGGALLLIINVIIYKISNANDDVSEEISEEIIY